MRTWQWGLIAWTGGSLIALLFAFVHHGEGWGAFDRIVQVISALATTAAVVVALRLAQKQAELAKKQETDRAVLVAAGVEPMLIWAATDLEKMCISVGFRPAPEECKDLEELRGIHIRLRYAISNLMQHQGFNLSQDVLLGLIPLPNNAASRLHAVCAVAKSLHELTVGGMDFAWAEASEFKARERQFEEWTDQLYWMKDQLDIAVPEIEKAAAIGAPPPARYDEDGFIPLQDL